MCGTDFSEISDAATRVATDLARRFGDSLVLASAIAPVYAAPPPGAFDIAVVDRALREAAREGLARVAKQLRSEGLSVEEAAVDGHPDVVLLELGRRHDARFIVLGTHGRRAPARWLLGSTAERVLDGADRPVVVVPDKARSPHAWAIGARALKVWAGLDRSRAADAAIEGVRALRAAGPCDVTFLHLYWPPDEYARFGLGGASDVMARDEELHALLERELGARLPTLPGQGTIRLQLQPSWGNTGASLGDRPGDEVDLLVVGMHQRHGLSRLAHGSVSHDALRGAKVPVLCVPSAKLPVEGKALPSLDHVLVATDFSELAARAIPYAYAMVRPGGRVALCHAYERPLTDAPGTFGTEREPMPARERAELEQRLAALVPEASDGRGIRTRVEVLDAGSPAHAIVRAAERLGVDAICLSSHGRTGALRTLLGSVAEEVLRSSERPVLVVRGRQD